MRNLRLPGELIGLGFGGVVAWAVTFAIAGQPPNEVWIFELATAAGYGLAGFACWRWIVGNWKAQADKSIVRGPSRLMAAAAVVTAAGVARVTYWTYQVHSSLMYDGAGDTNYRLRLVGAAAGTLGFLFAAAGFWIASSARPTAQVETSALQEGQHPDQIPEPGEDVRI